jgi:NAD(P)-dependent dehydrogenase (short-subunit alcohol dehydrogenase family)
MENYIDKIALITGANVGLGYETALDLAGRGMSVILACRNEEKANAARERIKSLVPSATVFVMAIDMSSLTSVREFASEFSRRFNRLDLLVNNAGIMMPSFSLTEDGFENQLATNYLGHYALTGLLLPHLLQTDGSRVITLSSLAHRWADIQLNDLHFAGGYKKTTAYGQSKLACLMFAYELDRKLKENRHQTISLAAHPGASNTNLAQHLPKALRWLSPLIGQSPEAGAQPIVHAALSPDLEGGEYVGPNGFKEWRGKPVLVSSSPASKNQQVAKALWKKSEELTGVKFEFSVASYTAKKPQELV